MFQKLIISLILGLIPSLCMAETSPVYLMVIKDKINMRTEPAFSAKIANHAIASLQLKKIGESKDNKWLKVKMGEQKGYQLSHGKEYWVFAEDVHSELLKPSSQLIVDMSVMENGPINLCKRIGLSSIENITFKGRKIESEPLSYLSPIFTYSVSTSSCSKPFNFCAEVFPPDFTFIDFKINEEIRSKLKTFTPFYKLNSNVEIKKIVETLKTAKIVMKRPGCYADKYIGTEVNLIARRELDVNNHSHFSSFQIPIEDFFNTRLAGGVQYINILLILEITYSNGQKETIVRRIHTWWPRCA